MNEVVFQLEIITPLFMSGANPNEAELRAPAIKGQLRWWWRALHGNLPITQLKDNEERIFGSTNARSAFSVQVNYSTPFKTSKENLPPGEIVKTTSRGREFSISVIDYLAFGIAKNGRVNRPYIIPGTKFQVYFRFYKDENKNEVLNAFYAMLKYGGLGSKSRNGFGCLFPVLLPQLQFAPVHDKGYYPCFSNETRLFEFKKHPTWENALAEIGTAYRAGRLNLEPRHSFNKRALVAKPIEVKGEISIKERHAKNFFLHVKKTENEFQGQILNLPYNYYEESEQTNYVQVNLEMCNFLAKHAQEVKDVF